MTSPRVRIVLATNNLLIGGAQQLIVTLARHLPAAGFDVTVLDLVAGPSRRAGLPEPMRPALEATGVPVVDFAVRSIRHVSEWRRAGAWLRAARPDIVHGHLAPADRWAAALGRLAGARTLTTKHDTYRHVPARARWTEAAAYRLVFHRIQAISATTRDHLEATFHVPADRIDVVPNPVDARRFDPTLAQRAEARRELGLPAGAFIVGYVGRLVPRKGLEVWLAAAAALHRRLPDSHFVVVGGGDQMASLRRQAASAGVAAAVTFAGPREDVPRWLAAFDALLFTPLWGEGLSIALLEAMAAGLPVVASNVGANREQLAGVGLLPEPAAWVFDAPALDHEAFAAALATLAAEPARGRRMGQAARRRVLERYDVPVVLARQIDLYHRLLGG